MKTVKIYFNNIDRDIFHHYTSFWDEQDPQLLLLREDLRLSLEEYRYNFTGNMKIIYTPYRDEELKSILKSEEDQAFIYKQVALISNIIVVQQTEEVKLLDIDHSQLKTLTYIGEFKIDDFWDNLYQKKAYDIYFYSGCFKSRRAVDKFLEYRYNDDDEVSDFSDALGGISYDPDGLCVFFGKKMKQELIGFIGDEELAENIVKDIPSEHNSMIAILKTHDNSDLEESDVNNVMNDKINYLGCYECWI